MAIDLGHISSVDAPVFDYFPEHGDLVAQDPRRGDMTVEHLLLMTSGLRWNDLETYSYDDPRNDLIQMWGSDDPIRYALSREMETDPGTNFEYCNANTNILGEIVRRASGFRLNVFSGEHLFAPLGVQDFEWQMMPNDVVFASGDLRLRPRDMAKFGQLFLDLGRWGGEEVVSGYWVEAATERIVVPDGPHAWADGYGYGWWHWDLYSGAELYQTYQASGWGGQWIVVVPDHQMVVVSTGGNYFQAEPMPIQRILTEYVFPALG
jgi:CubicO group peptidase (beta-lactamase class C family)